jgi:rhodanese-related sulfurtransferase
MTIKTINAIDALNLLKKEEAVMIDVRRKYERDAGFIEGSIHMPLDELSVLQIQKYKSKKIIMQCRSGIRSMTACEMCNKSDDSLDLYNLEGGIIAFEYYNNSI